MQIRSDKTDNWAVKQGLKMLITRLEDGSQIFVFDNKEVELSSFMAI